MMLSKMAHYRNFMGYSSSKTQLMIDWAFLPSVTVGTSFAECKFRRLLSNTRMEQITGFRGHLTNEDLIIKHILNLMCQFETSWKIKPIILMKFQMYYYN
jgi:oxygen-independent coproporphyrinogen-3 oxidase